MTRHATITQAALFEGGARARPFVKWAGGKSRLLPALLPHVPATFNRYHEPFLGGGAMFFATSGRNARGAYVSDLNAELVNAWQIVRTAPARLHEELERYASEDSESFYYEIRAQRATGKLQRAAHFLYLNRTSWNGLYRVNRWGQFNVPWGARAFVAPPLELLTAVAEALRGVTIRHEDFREALERCERGDFVYLDPPYLQVSDTSKFNGYTERRFRRADLTELAECLRRLTARGVTWLLSNRDSDPVRELFTGYQIVPLTVRRAVAAQNRRAVEPVDSPEVIVIGTTR
jgi:DNA adenine methylase